ncbi:MAG: hypothetical protein AVDCRST_MAG66-2798 [uncultured Pseudonocardia sp.]|uniref:Secreted protein n=1 Tax=uncultured Pseudonocardia sp. TaxID=211455 RepID=A0A6J4PXT2_9PSEU|nr:MAG: hypothetical protein AVDCRST_MAG66-2798 [uncultured Pseudonocardia sp.]
MDTPPTSRGHRGTPAAVVASVATAVLAVLGVLAVVAGLNPDTGTAQPPLAAAPAADVSPDAPVPTAPLLGPAAADGGPAAVDLAVPTMARSRPVGLTIPAIGVDTTALVDLGKNPDGSLEVPTDFGQPGWFVDGPAPGQFGPAVLAGHVDSEQGPGIFYRLGELRSGDVVRVARADGSTAEFVIDKVERYAKDDFPTVAVYGDTTHRSELRLITCGGEFDSRTGSYVDNVVAYAHLLQ